MRLNTDLDAIIIALGIIVLLALVYRAYRAVKRKRRLADRSFVDQPPPF